MVCLPVTGSPALVPPSMGHVRFGRAYEARFKKEAQSFRLLVRVFTGEEDVVPPGHLPHWSMWSRTWRQTQRASSSTSKHFGEFHIRRFLETSFGYLIASDVGNLPPSATSYFQNRAPLQRWESPKVSSFLATETAFREEWPIPSSFSTRKYDPTSSIRRKDAPSEEVPTRMNQWYPPSLGDSH